MLTPLFWAVAVTFVVLVVAVEMGYLYRGRHRGRYVEKPEWRHGRGGSPYPGNTNHPPLWPFLPDGSLRDLAAEGWVDIGLFREDSIR